MYIYIYICIYVYIYTYVQVVHRVKSFILSNFLLSPSMHLHSLARRIECAIEGPRDEEDEFYDEVCPHSHDSFTCVPWLIHIRATRDSLIRDETQFCVT